MVGAAAKGGAMAEIETENRRRRGPGRRFEPGQSALRMRRRRERIKRGAVCVRFEMAPAAVDRLVELGWLKAQARDDWHAVIEALIRFGTDALWREHVTRH
jgi:hypothetical protein